MGVGDLPFMHTHTKNILCLIITAISVPLAALNGSKNFDGIMKDIANVKTPNKSASAILEEITETSKMQTLYGDAKVLTVEDDGVLTTNKPDDLYVGDNLVSLHTSHKSIKTIAGKNLSELPDPITVNAIIDWKEIYNSGIAIQSHKKKLSKQNFEHFAVESYMKYALVNVAIQLHGVKRFYAVKGAIRKDLPLNGVQLNLTSKTEKRRFTTNTLTTL
eukprot:GHVT01013205.1.p1 GENE.GHVT01013205.1~~GHVT01013205.1.p1  ORF type:complete len:218 (+),score=10.58 GHVT01013205.1:460-1113(+)